VLGREPRATAIDERPVLEMVGSDVSADMIARLEHHHGLPGRRQARAAMRPA
jgi:hypothetical protein